MTKSLTEQFRDGSFECGVYYCKVKDDGEEETKKLLLYHDGYGHGYAQQFGYEEDFPYEDILEVLAHVPSYDEWKELVDSQKAAKKVVNSKTENRVCKLEHQLAEANEIVKDRAFVESILSTEQIDRKGNVVNIPKPAIEYCEKWGVK